MGWKVPRRLPAYISYVAYWIMMQILAQKCVCLKVKHMGYLTFEVMNYTGFQMEHCVIHDRPRYQRDALLFFITVPTQ